MCCETWLLHHWASGSNGTMSHLKRYVFSEPPLWESHILHSFLMLVHLSTSQRAQTTWHFHQIQETNVKFCLTCMSDILITIWIIFHYMRKLGTYPQTINISMYCQNINHVWFQVSATKQMRTAFFWATQGPSLKDGTDRLSRNISSELPLHTE